ncbi:uncharacterized protein LOC125487099 [Rhincodon typus]|uniref:uncharacterized protein LOC125487099 n=1 Tax=Rhincodon typus TaxID=259920 RepID=UPI00202FBE78|nr:uncharacterized protein LOC125487099 [Rhincodon typus]
MAGTSNVGQHDRHQPYTPPAPILAQEVHKQMDMVNEAVTRGEQLMSELPEVEAQSVKEKLQSLRSRFTQLQANIEENGNGYWARERTDLSYCNQKLVNIWLQRIEKDVSSLSCQCTVSLRGVCDHTEWDKLEKVLQEELCWVCGVEEMLKQVNVVPLSQEAVCDQLQNHKAIAVQTTQCQHRMAELFTSFKKILGKCSQSRQETTQALLRTLCDQCEAISLQNTGILLGLERASFLLTQFSETDTELRSCLQETQSRIAQLHPIVIDRQNLSQQQELSQLLEQVAVLSDSLQKVQDRVQKPSGFPSDSERIQEQIEENRSIFEELGSLRRAPDNVIAQGKELLANSQNPTTDARNGGKSSAKTLCPCY